MSAKSGGEENVCVLGMVAHDRVLVPGVVIVEAAPSIFDLKKVFFKDFGFK